VRRLAQFALSLGSLAIVAILAELALRVATPWLALPRFRPGGYLDSQLHHRYPPSARMHDRFGRERYEVRTNEDGLRSPWSREAFLERELRVAVLGDSFAFGYGLPEAQTLSSLLEERLEVRRGRDDVAVLGAGVITYSPLLAQALFEDVVRDYRPTLTLLLLDISDVADDHRYAGQRAKRDGGRRFAIDDQPLPESSLRHLALWNLTAPIRTWWQPAAGQPPPARGRRPADIRVDGELQGDHFFVMRHPLAKTRPFFEGMLRNIDALAAEVRAAGSDFALVIGPRHVHWDPAESPHNPEAVKYGQDGTYHAEYLRFFEEVEGGLDYPVVHLLPAFRASPERPLVFDHDPHWNAAGHALVAEVLAGFVQGRVSAGAPASVRMRPTHREDDG